MEQGWGRLSSLVRHIPIIKIDHSYQEEIMVLTFLRTMLSSATTAATATATTAATATTVATTTTVATATTAQWKWEVNHDGAFLAYQGSPSAPSAPSGLQESVPRPRTSLVDYWYLVHDGVVIPTVNDH